METTERNIETVEHVSNERGEGLEDIIKEYQEKGWYIRRVEWEYFDDMGPCKRWKAFFQRG